MALADFILARIPLPHLPHYLTTYVPGETPLSTTPSVLSALASYLAVIYGLQTVMRNQQVQKLTPIFRAHNMFLSIGSLVLLVLMLEEMLPIVWKNGVLSAICADESWTDVSTHSVVDLALKRVSENGVLLYDQLLLQIYRTFRYRVPCFSKKAVT